jgi:hypothetical protein
MKYVRLQYTGKKPSLHLIMARLKAEYTFEKGNEMTAPVAYEDAAYLLRTNVTIFKVVGGPFEAEEKTALDRQEAPRAPGLIVEANDWNDKTVQGAPARDGVEGDKPIPAIGEAEKTPVPKEPKATVKKGKK